MRPTAEIETAIKMHFLSGLFLLCLGSVQAAVQNAVPAATFLPGVRYVFGYGSSATLLEDLKLGVQGEVGSERLSWGCIVHPTIIKLY